MNFFSKNKLYFGIIVIFIIFTECFVSATEIEYSRIPKIWNVNNANEYFTGRVKLLDNLHQSFTKNDVIAIVGGPGFGKSQLAKKYAQVYKHHYDLVWWFDVNRDMGEQVVDLATEWNRHSEDKKLQINIYLSPDDVIQQLRDRLRITNLDWLLIFDDVVDKGQIATYLPERHNQNGRGDVLVTSRNVTAWQETIKIDEFTEDESIELLTKITKESNLEEAAILVDKLKNYPLVIAQAASYIKLHPGLNIKQYNKLFSTNRDALWKEDDLHKSKYQALDDYNFTAYTTLFLTIEKLQQESPEAFHLLILCSMLNNKKIPTQFLKASLADHYSSNSLEQEKAIACLLRYALLLKDEMEDGYKVHKLNEAMTNLDETLTIHATVQVVVQDMLSDEVKKMHLTNALVSMTKFLPNKLRLSNSMIVKYDFLLAHINALKLAAQKQKIYNSNLINMLVRQLEYALSSRLDLVASQKIISEIEEALKHAGAVNSRVLCRFYLMKGTYYDWAESDFKKSLKEAEKAWQMLQNEPAEYQEELLMVYNSFGIIYNRLGNNEEAIKYAALGEKLTKTYSGHLEYEERLFYTFAKIYIDKGDLMQALHYINKSRDIIKQRSEEIMLCDMPIYMLEIDILRRLGQIDKAYAKLSPLYLQTNNLFPNDYHSLKGHIMILYGYLSALMKHDIQTAKDILLKGQKMMQELTEDFYQRKIAALSYKFLGNIYEYEGEYEKAQTEYLNAAKLYQNSIYSTAVAIDDISDVYAKLAVVGIKLEDRPVAQHYLDLHRKYFGYEHKRTKEITKLMFEAKMQIDF